MSTSESVGEPAALMNPASKYYVEVMHEISESGSPRPDGWAWVADNDAEVRDYREAAGRLGLGTLLRSTPLSFAVHFSDNSRVQEAAIHDGGVMNFNLDPSVLGLYSVNEWYGLVREAEGALATEVQRIRTERLPIVGRLIARVMFGKRDS